MDFGSIVLGAGKLLGGVLSGAGAGSIFGLFGSIIGIVSKHFQEKQRQAWEVQKWDHETKLLELNMKARAEETEQELAIVSQQGSWTGLAESIQADRSIGKVHIWVNDLRALFRLFLTTILWILAAWVFSKVISGVLKEWLSEIEVKDLIAYMVYSVFFCASTATVWWFGDRALTPPGLKNK